MSNFYEDLNERVKNKKTIKKIKYDQNMINNELKKLKDLYEEINNGSEISTVQKDDMNSIYKNLIRQHEQCCNNKSSLEEQYIHFYKAYEVKNASILLRDIFLIVN
ncbi:39470_t:CDS:1, partial [Gigaspora margarita]